MLQCGSGLTGHSVGLNTSISDILKDLMHVCILIKPIVVRVRAGQFFGTIDMLHYQHATLIISNNDLFL